MEKKEFGLPEGVASALAKLAEYKLQLDELDDRLSSQLRVIEERLCDIGIRFSVALFESSDGVRRSVTYLELDKLQGKWRLLVETVEKVDPTHNFIEIVLSSGPARARAPKPLMDCSRDFRAEAMAKYVPRLVEAAVEQLHKRLTSRQVAVATAESLVAELPEVKK